MRRIPWLTAVMSLSICFVAGYAAHYLIAELLPPLPGWGQNALIISAVCVMGPIMWAALSGAIRNQLETQC
jgi:hypothetical protein